MGYKVIHKIIYQRDWFGIIFLFCLLNLVPIAIMLFLWWATSELSISSLAKAVYIGLCTFADTIYNIYFVMPILQDLPPDKVFKHEIKSTSSSLRRSCISKQKTKVKNEILPK